MSIIDDVKSVVNAIQKIDNVEAYRKILDLQGEVIDLVQENRDLQQSLTELAKKLDIRGDLLFRDDAYYTSDGDGPFCSGCWDSEKKIIRLHEVHTVGLSFKCPLCKTSLSRKPSADGND